MRCHSSKIILRQPIIVSFDNQRIHIDCLFTFNKKALKMTTSDTETLFVDAIESGIRDNWSGTYDLTEDLRSELQYFSRYFRFDDDSCFEDERELKSHIEVNVSIQRDQRGGLPPLFRVIARILTGKRRPARIYVRRSLFLPAHVASPLPRRIWGIFRTGQLESIGLNWSPRFPGYMTIPQNTKLHRLGQVAAHEAGHLFGIGDAYDAWYRFYHATPGTEQYMMRNNNRVQSHEIAMLLRAHTRGKMSYFPRAWNWKDVRRGVFHALRSPYKKLSKFLNRSEKI